MSMLDPYTRRCVICGDPIYTGSYWDLDEDGNPCHEECLDDGFYYEDENGAW